MKRFLIAALLTLASLGLVGQARAQRPMANRPLAYNGVHFGLIWVNGQVVGMVPPSTGFFRPFNASMLRPPLKSGMMSGGAPAYYQAVGRSGWTYSPTAPTYTAPAKQQSFVP